MKKLAFAVVGGVACGMVVPKCASAQEPGERVRVTLPSERFVGVVSEATPAEIVLAMVDDEDGGLRTVVRDEIRHVERSLGRQRRGMGKWAMYGAVGGAGFGILQGSGALGEVRCGGNFFQRGRVCSGEGSTITAFAFGFGLLGAMGGGLYGLLAKAEVWEMIEAGGSQAMIPGFLFDVETGSVGLTLRM